MTEMSAHLEALVQTLVEPLLEFPEELKLSSKTLEDGRVLVEISVHESDTGKVIGRSGRVIKAVRTLARAVASKQHVQAEVELID